MIAACPGCGARYRVDSSRVGPRGARVRCSSCEEIFRVEAPGHREAYFLVADADSERAKRTASFISERGARVLVVHDGVEAFLNLLREVPSVAIFDETLPRVAGSALCEVVKRDPVLSRIHVVLGVAEEGTIATVLDGAEPDSVVSWDDLGGWLLKRLGAVESKNECELDETKAARSFSEGSTRDGDEFKEETGNAERLARIVVSDIVLYDPERFDEAARAGRLPEVLAAELREGRALLERRIDPRVLEDRDFLVDELADVVRKRGFLDAPD